MDKIEAFAARVMEKPIPFVPGGRTIEGGLDCWGLFRLGYKEVHNIDLPTLQEDYDPSQIRDFEHLKKIVLKDICNWDKIDKEKPGDGILLSMRGRPIHVALVVKTGLMLHIEEGINACVENYRSSQWQKRILGFYRFNPGKK